jgi:hypothetical protein
MGFDDTPALASAFERLLSRLAVLSRKHLLFFRIEVGRAVSDELYGGDPAQYFDQAPNKDNSLRQFAAEKEEQLRDLGLSEATLRQSLRGWFVVQELRHEIVASLMVSHVVELAKVADRATRRLLAEAVHENGWTGSDLKKAIIATEANKWIDGDPRTPGLQPPDPEAEPPHSPQIGRVVTRVEKIAEHVDEVLAQWEQVPVEKLTKKQQARVRDAVRAVKERVARLESRLPRQKGA